MIYIGNLFYEATSEDLKTIFENYGAVKQVTLQIDRETGKMNGSAFVEMFDDDIENIAIESLDGTEWFGRDIKVNKANPKAEEKLKDIIIKTHNKLRSIGLETQSVILSDQEQQDNRLVLYVEVSANSPSDTVALELSNLCKAINAYHIACNGTGLTIDDWEILVPARQFVGV
jgi:RNA recognition motif-containing protein